MGADIHCFIEYRKPKADYWASFGGRINPGRNYEIFGRLAGVRSKLPPAIPLRGFPDDAGYWSRDNYHVYVSESETPVDGQASKANAERWVQQGISKWGPSGTERAWVTDPDAHSVTWMTPDEWEPLTQGNSGPEYAAMTTAMRSIEAQGYQVRVVFWFDN